MRAVESSWRSYFTAHAHSIVELLERRVDDEHAGGIRRLAQHLVSCAVYIQLQQIVQPRTEPVCRHAKMQLRTSGVIPHASRRTTVGRVDHVKCRILLHESHEAGRCGMGYAIGPTGLDA